MSEQWCVLLKTGQGYHVYGPMGSVEAQAFALFLGETVDPAIVLKMVSPEREMLAWYQAEKDRNNCTHDGNCRVHPEEWGTHDRGPTRKGATPSAGGQSST